MLSLLHYFWINLRAGLVFFVFVCLLCGLVYPMAVTGIAQTFFARQANGGLVKNAEGVVVGAEVIGQKFNSRHYFWSRPSKGDLNMKGRVDRQFERMVPVDLATPSASGLDPHLTPEAVYYQIPRISKTRRIPYGELRRLVDIYVEGPQYGILGERRVNILKLNLALDAMSPGHIRRETHAGESATSENPPQSLKVLR